MSDKELIATIARDLLVKLMEKDLVKLNLRGGNDLIDDLGERFKVLATKVQEALKSLKE